jgi:hypothetical protein
MLLSGGRACDEAAVIVARPMVMAALRLPKMRILGWRCFSAQGEGVFGVKSEN